MLNVEQIVGSGDQEQLDYISYSPETLLYANPRFLKLISQHLNAETSWLVVRKNGVIVGMLPFMVKDGTWGKVYNSLAYYGSNGGVIQHRKDNEAKQALIDAFYQSAVEQRACAATIITNPLEQDNDIYEAYTQFDYRDERIGQITHFPDVSHSEELIKSFQNPRPRNIRRALKAGVKVEKTHSEFALEFLYKTHLENMLAIGGKPKLKSFFDKIEHFMNKDEWSIFLAYLDGEPISALLLFYFNQTVEYFTPVIVERYRSTQALALTIYTAMQDAIQLGYRNWNWGGTWLSQKGVYDFKKRWGTSEYSYYYYTRIFSDKILGLSKDELMEVYSGFYVLPFSELNAPNL